MNVQVVRNGIVLEGLRKQLKTCKWVANVPLRFKRVSFLTLFRSITAITRFICMLVYNISPQP